jgi:gliding motility-associated lipoprotein GldD
MRRIKNIGFLLIVAISFVAVSCKDDAIPKPKGHLRLDYPTAKYKSFAMSSASCGYEFDVNEFSKIKTKGDCSMEIQYPKMKATVYLNYKTVNNNIEELLRDAQKLTYEHVIKADDIAEQPFVNPAHKAYGMFYQVGGNAATNAQFYVTDSTRHFLVGSVYFYAKPNYDSILPAAAYIKNDMRKIMETVKWK